MANGSPTRIFLCHSWGDKAAVRELYDRLRGDGLDPWLDDVDLLPGQDWHVVIEAAVRASAVVIVILSKESIARTGFVNKEIRFALDVAEERPEGSIFVIPARLDQCEIPIRLRRWNAANLYDAGGYEKLLKALRAKGLVGADDRVPRPESGGVVPLPTEPVAQRPEVFRGAPLASPQPSQGRVDRLNLEPRLQRDAQPSPSHDILRPDNGVAAPSPTPLQAPQLNLVSPEFQPPQHGTDQPSSDPPPPKDQPAPPNRRSLRITGAMVALLAIAYGAWRFYPTAADPSKDISKGGAPASVPTVTPKSPAPPPPPESASPAINPNDGLKYVWISSGHFMMGCDNCNESNEKPAHDVQITKGFWLGQTEVTQRAYSKVTGQKPSGFTGDDLPVEQVSWDDATKYCQAIGGRLPTEAQWEYAARGSKGGQTYGELGDIAWYDGNSSGRTHPVAQKKPNGFGLYDMLGNVWEWTGDWYTEDYYRQRENKDPQGPPSGTQRALRGGSWYIVSTYVRASFRNRFVPGGRFNDFGFRCHWEQRFP